MVRQYLGVFALMGVLTGIAVAGDLPPENSKPLSTILKQLESGGLSQIKSVEFDDGVWEIEGMRNKGGVEVHVNPLTGDVVSEHKDLHSNLPPASAKSAATIVTLLEEAGYAPVYELEWERTIWTAEAIHKNSKRKLTIAPDTGKVVSDRMDD